MFPIDAFKATLAKATRVFRELGIHFHLTGGITSIAYGEPRMTQDIDIVLDPVTTRLQGDALLEALTREGFLLDHASARDALVGGRLFRVLDIEQGLKLDLYPRELVSNELQRSRQYEIFKGTELPIVSLPDAIVSKLIWVRKGSHKSRRDIRRTHARATAEQREMIEVLAEAHGVLDLLGTVLAEPDEIE